MKKGYHSIEKGFTLLEILVALSIFTLIVIIMTKVFTLTMKISDQLEKFSFESKKIEIFIEVLKKVVEKTYTHPFYISEQIEGYDDLKTYKLGFKCPIYAEKLQGLSSGTALLRLLQYDPKFIGDLYHGLFITEIKYNASGLSFNETASKTVSISMIPVFFNDQINKDIASKSKEKEYILISGIENFNVEFYVRGEWKKEFTCETTQNEEKKNEEKSEIPKYIRISFEEKTNNEENMKKYSFVIKL